MMTKIGKTKTPMILEKLKTIPTLTTSKVIKKGEQIYLSYGKRSNACLLLNYGFAYDDNPYDYAEIMHHIWPFYLKLDMINLSLLASLRGGWEIGYGEILVVT